MESKINFSIEQVSILNYTTGLDSGIFKKSLEKIVAVFFKSDTFKCIVSNVNLQTNISKIHWI